MQFHWCVLALVAISVGATNLRMNHRALVAPHPGRWVVALDKDLKTQMLIQMKNNASMPAPADPCGGITCGSLKCPAGFTVTELEGHCCPYCVNPDIKIEAAITGATGSNGGKESTFCKDVWCFPTMCTKGEVAPTTTNGQCCSVCPAL